MKRKVALWMVFVFVLVSMLSACGGKSVQAKPEKAKADEATKVAEAVAKEKEALGAGVEAVVYGLPVAIMDITMKKATNVAKPEGFAGVQTTVKEASTMTEVITVLNFIQSVVVILGAGFVCVQIHLQRKQNVLQTTQLKTSNYLSVMEARNRITEREIADPDLMEIYASDAFPALRTLEDWQKLTLKEKRLYMHLGTIVSAAEKAYTFAQSKALSTKDLDAEMSALREMFCLPIFGNSWPYLKLFYRDEFANKVDQMMRGKNGR